MARQLADEDCWQLLLAASKADSAIERAVASGEPAHVARYALSTGAGVQQLLSRSIHVLRTSPIAEKKTFLLWMTEYFRVQLERTLAVLGIEVPEYM